MVVLTVFAAALVAVVALVFWYAHQFRYTARQIQPLVGTWTQHACKEDGRIVVVYQSEAAKDHDTRWARGDGGYSVARRMRGTTWDNSVPDGPWFRTYAESFDTLQRKD